MGNKRHIAVCSTVHQFDDPRVFHRQAQTLSKKYATHLYVCAPFRQKLINSRLKIWGLPIWEKKSDRVRNILQLISYLWKENASVYILHDPELLIIVPFLKFFKKGKIIYDIHENYRYLMTEKLWIPEALRNIIAKLYVLIENIILHFVDMIWYPVDNIGKHYDDNRKIKKLLVPNVPDLNHFEFKVDSYPKDNILIYLGTIVEDRGIRELVLAFKKILQKFPSYKLKLIGHFLSENYKTEILNLIKEKGLEGKAEWVNRLPYREIPGILSRTKIGYINYLPTPNNMNTLSNKLFEYLSMGIPVIAPAYPNYIQILEKHNCGICVNPANIDEIANATIELLQDEQKRVRMGKTGQKLFNEKYNWEKNEANLFKAVRNLFEEK